MPQDQADAPVIIPPARPSNRRAHPARTIMALILREMSTSYGRSPGGYVWAIIEPLGAIIVLSIGFSLLLRNPSLGTSFILFYSTGYLPLNLYMILSNRIAAAIVFSRPLLKYPAVTWMDAILARSILSTLTSILVTYLLLAGILAIVESRTVLDMGPIIEAMSMAILLGIGIGALNCALFGLFPVWQQVWGVATRPLFLMSAVIYIYEDLPQFAQQVIWYNPLAHITGLMRTGFYPMYAPQYISPIYVISWGLISLVLGLILLGRYHQDILNNR